MEQDKIWDYFQNEDGINDVFAGAFPRYNFLAQQTASGMQALNIGVGNGGLENILINKGVAVSCLDPSSKSIENIRQKYSLGDRTLVGYSHAIPFPDGQFDAVIMTEVLEHLDDNALNMTTKEVNRVLKPGGRFIGTVPVDENLFEGRVMCPQCGVPFHRWGHTQ